jgi:hypothetical protein
MDQPVTQNRPDIKMQIEFVRGARHLVSDEKRQVEVTKQHYELLTAIEENLIGAKAFIEAEKRMGTKALDVIDAEIKLHSQKRDQLDGFERALMCERIATLMCIKNTLEREVYDA